MKTKTKIVYGIAILLSFLPLSVLVVIQSIFALQGSYDTKLTVDADEATIVDIIAYDQYNEDITDLLELNDEDGKAVLFSVIEATKEYMILELHGGKVDNNKVRISGLQFILSNGQKTELVRGIAYLRFKNVGMQSDSPNWVRDAWLRDFILDIEVLYETHYEQPAGTISYLWIKIIAASVGTLLGIVTVGLVILRKATKALVRRYWRIAVLVALFEGTIILGVIAWIVSDMWQVFGAATIGWAIFLGTEKIAMTKGYIDTPAPAQMPLSEVSAMVQNDINSILAKYKR